MSEKALRNMFIFGTVFFMVVLVAMSVDSLGQVNAGRTPPVTDQVAAGKQVWNAKNCNDCHTILGIGGYYAPDLTKVMDRRGAAWLRAWLKDEKAVDPKATMPNQRLAAADIENMVAFLQWVGQIDTNNWPPAPAMSLGGSSTASGASAGGAPASPGVAGELVFQQKGCAGCHMLNGKGAAGPGPDLSHVAGKPQNTPEFLAKFLENPPAAKPGSTMPALPMSEAERSGLVRYLSTLK